MVSVVCDETAHFHQIFKRVHDLVGVGGRGNELRTIVSQIHDREG